MRSRCLKLGCRNPSNPHVMLSLVNIDRSLAISLILSQITGRYHVDVRAWTSGTALGGQRCLAYNSGSNLDNLKGKGVDEPVPRPRAGRSATGSGLDDKVEKFHSSGVHDPSLMSVDDETMHNLELLRHVPWGQTKDSRCSASISDLRCHRFGTTHSSSHH